MAITWLLIFVTVHLTTTAVSGQFCSATYSASIRCLTPYGASLYSGYAATLITCTVLCTQDDMCRSLFYDVTMANCDTNTDILRAGAEIVNCNTPIKYAEYTQSTCHTPPTLPPPTTMPPTTIPPPTTMPPTTLPPPTTMPPTLPPPTTMPPTLPPPTTMPSTTLPPPTTMPPTTLPPPPATNGEACTVATDCTDVGSECRDTMCKCMSGYSFQPSSATCISPHDCTSLGDTYQTEFGAYLLGFPGVTYYEVASDLDCMNLCTLETTILCITAEFFLPPQYTCYLSIESLVSQPAAYTLDLTYNIHTRNCGP